jgi:uncharacterized protein YdbL (DUF1318 family)
MADIKNGRAPKENSPIPIAHRNSGGNANINSFLVQMKKEVLAISNTSARLAEIILQYGKTELEILERLQRIEQKLDDLQPKRMQSDSGLSFINVNSESLASNTPSPRTKRSMTPEAESTSTTASIVSLPQVEKQEPEVDASLMPPGLQNSILAEYFPQDSKTVVVEEVTIEEIAGESNPTDTVKPVEALVENQPVVSEQPAVENQPVVNEQHIGETVKEKKNVEQNDPEIDALVADITNGADENLKEIAKPSRVKRSKTVATVSAATAAAVSTVKPRKKRTVKKTDSDS